MSQKPISDAKGIPIRTFGRRRTKGLRSTRANAMEDVLPQVQIALSEGNALLEPSAFFNFPVKEIWFEIGFGNGEHLLHQALSNPAVGFIGCEPFMNGVAALCVGIQEKKVRNIRIWPDDARMLMERFKFASLDRVFLLHPDPWPKSRHHKRRFVQPETLDRLAQLLKPGAEFRMATDHPELAAWLLEKTYFHPAFKWLADSAEGWRNPPTAGAKALDINSGREASWPETRYGQKGLKQGRPPVYLSFKRA